MSGVRFVYCEICGRYPGRTYSLHFSYIICQKQNLATFVVVQSSVLGTAITLIRMRLSYALTLPELRKT